MLGCADTLLTLESRASPPISLPPPWLYTWTARMLRPREPCGSFGEDLSYSPLPDKEPKEESLIGRPLKRAFSEEVQGEGDSRRLQKGRLGKNNLSRTGFVTYHLFVCLFLSRHRNLILPRMAWTSAMKTVCCLPRPTEGTMATAGGFPSQSEAGTWDRV